MSEKLDKLRASLEKERERRIKINTRIESLERRIQEAEAAEVNEMVRSAKVSPEQLAALLHIPGLYRLVPGVFCQIHPERFRPGGGLCPKRAADRQRRLACGYDGVSLSRHLHRIRLPRAVSQLLRQR